MVNNMRDNLLAGAQIMSDDGRYSEGTREGYEAFVKVRNASISRGVVTGIVSVLGGVSYDDDGEQLTPCLMGEDLYKFALMVAEECARIAAATPCPYTIPEVREKLGHTWDMACFESAKEIRTRFGV